MKVRITSPGEFDRHEAEVRFVATVDGRLASFTITTYALFIIGEALEMPLTDPVVIYAASGRLLEAVVADVVRVIDEPQATYLITHFDVLRVTGRSGEGHSDVPTRWPR